MPVSRYRVLFLATVLGIKQIVADGAVGLIGEELLPLVTAQVPPGHFTGFFA